MMLDVKIHLFGMQKLFCFCTVVPVHFWHYAIYFCGVCPSIFHNFLKNFYTRECSGFTNDLNFRLWIWTGRGGRSMPTYIFHIFRFFCHRSKKQKKSIFVHANAQDLCERPEFQTVHAIAKSLNATVQREVDAHLFFVFFKRNVQIQFLVDVIHTLPCSLQPSSCAEDSSD